MKMHKIAFPTELYELMQVKTQQVGLSIPEYVRHVVINDIEKTPIEIASPELEKGIDSALRDVGKDKYIVIKNKKDLKKFVEDL